MRKEVYNEWVAADDALETRPCGSIEEIVKENNGKFQEEEMESSDGRGNWVRTGTCKIFTGNGANMPFAFRVAVGYNDTFVTSRGCHSNC